MSADSATSRYERALITLYLRLPARMWQAALGQTCRRFRLPKKSGADCSAMRRCFTMALLPCSSRLASGVMMRRVAEAVCWREILNCVIEMVFVKMMDNKLDSSRRLSVNWLLTEPADVRTQPVRSEESLAVS